MRPIPASVLIGYSRKAAPVAVLLALGTGSAHAQTVLSGDHEITGGLVVDGNASAAHVSAVSSQGGAAFYGRQVGSSFANAQPILSAVTDNTNGTANWFFRGKVGGDSGPETFSIRADGTIKSAALAIDTTGWPSSLIASTVNLVGVRTDGSFVRAGANVPVQIASAFVGSIEADKILYGMNGGAGITVSSGSWGGGYATEAGAIASTGLGSLASGFAESAGTILSSGVGSVALGAISSDSYIKAIGSGSFAIGYAGLDQNGGYGGLTSSGTGSVAMGAAISSDVVASGRASFALGQDVKATADNAFALGSSFTNSTPSTFKVGFSSTPTLAVSATQVVVAGGLAVTGTTGVALGAGTTATSLNSVALGRNNVAQGNSGTWVPTDDLVVVGNGNTTASNALAVHKNGNTRIAGDLDVKGTIRVKPSGDISMGDFTATPIANRNPATLNAGLRYSGE